MRERNKKMRRNIVCLIVFLVGGFFWPVEASLPEPASMPATLKGGFPHDPEVAHYYLLELAKEGKVTQEEMEKVEVYMIFRYARFRQDLSETKGMSEEEFICYMSEKQKLRDNPLKEFADHCGFSPERAKVLMNLLHDSNKGTAYYQKYKQKK